MMLQSYIFKMFREALQGLGGLERIPTAALQMQGGKAKGSILFWGLYKVQKTKVTISLAVFLSLPRLNPLLLIMHLRK